jgi:hypothetical protein
MYNPNPNPNLIDLSKPLDAGDVERILRALQDQQNQPGPTQQQPQSISHPPRPPMSMHQQQQHHQMPPQMMLPQHMPQYTMQQPPPPPQDDLFDKFMLDPSPSAPETNGQSAGFDFNQMYGGINPNHVHSSMGMQMNGGNGQNGSGNGQSGGDQLTWDQLRLWAASHGMQAPPGPM